MQITESNHKIDWYRIWKSLHQAFRREPGDFSRVRKAIEHLKAIMAFLGEREVRTRSRRNLRNVGIAIAASGGEKVRIISPICLSIPPGKFKHTENSQLVDKHVKFLNGFGKALPPWELVCLVPPPEKPDVETDKYVKNVLNLTTHYYGNEANVSCHMMSEFSPGMIVMEEAVIQEIASSPYLSNLCDGFMKQRARYYTSLGVNPHLWLRMNRRTMAQYIILGRLAALRGDLMCIHTTVNIHCAIYGGAGVLHNPVGFR
jgi:hypothetical protein